MQLTSHEAQKMIRAGERRALEIGVPVNVVVLDGGANLKAFTRMDGAFLGSTDVAIKKAKTAVLFNCNSEDVWEYCKPGGPAPSLEFSNGGLAPFAGGIPIKGATGESIGAIGVSGGSVQQDSEIANAAVSAFASCP